MPKDLTPILEERRSRIDNGSVKDAVILPGSFNGLTGRLVADQGFKATYISGAAVSASKGLPDIGVVTLNEFCEVIRDVSRSSGLPLIADADTGFGEDEMVRRTVCEYYRHGASGFHIEDQVFPKRCGHLDGKELVPLAVMVQKIRCARDASDRHCDGRFLICARTDARGVTNLDDAIERSIAYVNAGAHMLFPEGLTTKEEFASFATALQKCPQRPFLLANMTEFGKSPSLSAQELGEIGYDVVIFPVSSLRSAMFAVKELLVDIQKNGLATHSSLSKMQTRQDLYKTLRYTPGQHWKFPEPSSEC